MEFRKKLGYWVSAAFLALFGVLLIIIGSKYDPDVVKTLDIIIGVIFLLEGSAAILVSILFKKHFVSPLSMFGAISLSLGIYCLVKSFIGTFLLLFLDFVPYLLIVVGTLMLLQALVTFFLGKKKDVVLFVIQLVYSGIILTFGILGLTVFEKNDVKFIVLGVILCVYATYIVLGSFMPSILVIVAKTDDEPEEAEVIETKVNGSDNE